MRVAIILPGYSSVPIGGFRVHYEYANRLAARGHAVTVVGYIPSPRVRLGLRCRGIRRTVCKFSWFNFHPKVRLKVTNGRRLPHCDVIIVTAWQTAELLPTVRHRRCPVVQIAYDYEVWMSADPVTRSRMTRAFAYPDVLVATSNAVAVMLREAGRTADAMITCGIDGDAFYVTNDPASRPPVIGFVIRPGPTKCCEDAIAALSIARDRHAIRVTAVGVGRLNMPAWVEVIDAPADDDMRAFYNGLSIFVLPSEYEGWGLPAAEAMACGAAVVTTRNGGVEDFAEDGVNALLVPPRMPKLLAEACLRLLDQPRARQALSSGGVKTALTMNWNSSVDELEQILLDVRERAS